jgi:uncharacterized protein (TIGR02466 family)
VQVVNLFETPLIIDQVEDSARLNLALKAVILKRRAEDPGVRKSNWGGWQSDTQMLVWGGDPARQLAEHFLRLCNQVTAPAPGSQPNFLWSVEMWANVSSKGSANEAHVHPGAVWSSVYYVEAGSEDEGERSGGDLALYDPRMPASRMLPFDLRYRRPDGHVYQSLSAVRPVAGRIVIFPPWLLHSVHPYHGDQERISIAMNANAIANAVHSPT